jgi:hypothetical protein
MVVLSIGMPRLRPRCNWVSLVRDASGLTPLIWLLKRTNWVGSVRDASGLTSAIWLAAREASP